jgi:hypothetical protein
LREGWSVVMDNTHLRLHYIQDLLRLVETVATSAQPIEVSFQVFDVPPDVAIARDGKRTDVVGEVAIRGQHERLLLLLEQFDVKERIRFPTNQSSLMGNFLSH